MRAWVFAILVALGGPVAAQDAVPTREVLREAPLSGDAGQVVIVSRLVLPPGARIPLHTHPGDEHAVILTEGTALMPNGQVLSVRPDMTMFFPKGMVHGGVTNTGDAAIEILTTHILDADAPFQTAAE